MSSLSNSSSSCCSNDNNKNNDETTAVNKSSDLAYHTRTTDTSLKERVISNKNKNKNNMNTATSESEMIKTSSEPLSDTSKNAVNQDSITGKDALDRVHDVFIPSSSIIGKSKSSSINRMLLSSSSSDNVFLMTSLYALLAWLLLIAMVFVCTDRNEWDYLPIDERRACQLAMVVHLVALFLQLVKMGVSKVMLEFKNFDPNEKSESDSNTKNSSWFQNIFNIKPGSGILIAGFVIQFISLMTNALLAFAPTIVKIDPVTHSRVFLIRWCEWIPLSGAMTFLSEALDVNLNNNDETNNNNNNENKNEKDNSNVKSCSTTKVEEDTIKRRIHNTFNSTTTTTTTVTNDPIALRTVVLWSLTQSASCVPGILFPYAPNLFVWNIIMLWSMVLYFAIFPRVLVRRKLYFDLLKRHQHNVEKQAKTISMLEAKNRPDTSLPLPLPFTFNSSNMLLIEQENVQLRRFTYYLIFTCAGVWTLLCVFYFINFALHIKHPSITGKTQEGHWHNYVPIEFSSLAMMTDTSFDVVAKVIYMRLIVSVYLDVFDLSGRVQRQLHELHRLVSAIWESSSDVISISVRIHPYNLNRVVSMFSPSFTTLVEAGDIPFKSESTVMPSAALMLELDLPPGKLACDDKVPHYKIVSAYYVDSTSVAVPNLPNSNEKFLVLNDLNKQAVVEAARIVAQSWESIIDAPSGDPVDENVSSELEASADIHQKEDIVKFDDNFEEVSLRVKPHSKWFLLDHLVVTASGREHTCEMKVSRHAENALVAVVRDVTERDRRFEAERHAHAETLARQRDAQAANRFTRHEVKNGLLAGIELCDTLRNAFGTVQHELTKEFEKFATDVLVKHNPKQQAHDDLVNDGAERSSMPSVGDLQDLLKNRLNQILQDGMSRHVAELDKTLQDVLETTLTEAMSREVVHEVYVPRMERVNVPSWFERSDSCAKKERFPVRVAGKDTFPELLLDIQLLNYIHRNAISNACKYGKAGGIVATKVWYDHVDQLLQLEVSNEPGVGHQELLDMGDAASEAVFQQGVRLQMNSEVRLGGGGEDSRASSGDGAWIMQKCAMTLGGACSIQFLVNETIFSFICPALPATHDQPNFQEFRVPPTTWGIAVDDSSIQRKLMDRILANFGIEETRRFLLGEKPSDIEELRLLIKKILASSTDDKILILMDENLDYNEADSIPVLISGSNAMNDLLRSLEPQEESRLLALIRSANDSAEEIAFYSERSHGFFPKATMQRDRVREILCPLWKRRFDEPST